MPADGIGLPQKGDFGTSRWAARKLFYINHATGRKECMAGSWQCSRCPLSGAKRTSAGGASMSAY